MERLELLKEKREEILVIAAKHGAFNVRVFGSTVHGDATPDSDVDILVEVGQITSPWFPASLVADLEDLLGCPVDVVTQNSLHWYIRDRILAEAISV
ncbi:MAG: nucleotidyltransferase family protein [Anaerolineaceae bacterium]|nr:nucleotidyltransferase family protein [Anaerolineaceae bacterium]